jgi:hypothetical protein
MILGPFEKIIFWGPDPLMAACVTAGKRGMMVAMGHGLCVCFGVCGETTKNKGESKNVNIS